MTRQLILSLLIAAAPSIAGADVQTDTGGAPVSGARAHSQLGVTVGIATPVGEVGGEYTYVAGAHFDIGIGAGWAREGLQAAVMPHVRLAVGPVVLTLGAGVSGGRYLPTSPFASTETLDALWVNGEAGAELLSSAGFSGRLYGGLGTIAMHGKYNGDEKMIESTLPYVGVSVGHTL